MQSCKTKVKTITWLFFLIKTKNPRTISSKHSAAECFNKLVCSLD